MQLGSRRETVCVRWHEIAAAFSRFEEGSARLVLSSKTDNALCQRLLLDICAWKGGVDSSDAVWIWEVRSGGLMLLCTRSTT